jgi:hypothetical protein
MEKNEYQGAWTERIAEQFLRAEVPAIKLGNNNKCGVAERSDYEV